jgi:ketosteroid isomerase-like protein
MLAAADPVTTDVVAAAGVDAVPDAGVGSDEATLLAVAPAETEEAIAAPAAVVVPQDDAALVAVAPVAPAVEEDAPEMVAAAPAVEEDAPEMVAAAPAAEDVPDVVEEPAAEVVAVAPSRVATPVAAAVIEPVALADNVVVAAAPVDDAVVAVATPESELVAVSVGREVSAAVDQWRGMWESRDVEGYLALYHPEAAMGRSGGGRSAGRGQFTKVNLQARVESLFSEYGRIEVSVDNLDLSRDGDLVVSTFDQDLVAWRSDSDASPDYVDRGRKTLVMAQDDSSDWRIVSEKWRPIQ